MAAVFFNYIVGYMIASSDGRYAGRNKRVLLAIGLAQNICLLGYYKYTGFIIENWNTVSGQSLVFSQIVLPLGISFFTFQLIAYLLDCYRGNVEEHSPIHYLLFITFFPQLIVGPIVHHGDMIPQFRNEKRTFFDRARFMVGLFLFSLGCGKKVLLADPLTAYAEVFLDNIAGSDALTGGRR